MLNSNSINDKLYEKKNNSDPSKSAFISIKIMYDIQIIFNCMLPVYYAFIYYLYK